MRTESSNYSASWRIAGWPHRADRPGSAYARRLRRAPVRESAALDAFGTRCSRRFDRLLLAVNRWLVIVLLAAMAVMVFANVALRFLTDHSILWVEEVSRYTMVWLTFIGAGLVLRYGGHIGIDTLQQSAAAFCAGDPRAIIVVAARRLLLRDDRRSASATRSSRGRRRRR